MERHIRYLKSQYFTLTILRSTRSTRKAKVYYYTYIIVSFYVYTTKIIYLKKLQKSLYYNNGIFTRWWFKTE